MYGGLYQNVIRPLHDWLFPKPHIELELHSQYNTVPAYLETSRQKNMEWAVKWGTRLKLINNDDGNLRINDITFNTNSKKSLISSMSSPFYRVVHGTTPTLFTKDYPILLVKQSVSDLDIIFYIKVIPEHMSPSNSPEDKSRINHLIAPEFGCPTEKKECSETALNIHLNYTDDDGAEFSKSFPLLSKIDFIGKKSPTGGIISNYKVTPFSVLGYRMKEHVATVVYAGSSGEKDIYRKMTTEQLQQHFMANSSDFDICSILFARAVPEGDFIYASEILSTCKPSSIFEESMLKNNYAVLAIEEKNYSKGLAYLREAQKIQRCNYLSDKNLFEYYMFTKEYHKATGVALKRLTDCEDQVDHWAHVLYLLYPERNGYQNIIDVLKKIAASNPSDGNIQFYLGEAYRREKKYEEAIVYYENSSQLGTLFIKEALAEVSNIFRTRGEYIESEKYAKQLIDLDNESFLGHYHMAYAQFMQKEYEEAVRHYETALKIQPNHFAVLYELGELYFSLGEEARADNYRQLAKKHWPTGYGPPKELITPK